MNDPDPTLNRREAIATMGTAAAAVTLAACRPGEVEARTPAPTTSAEATAEPPAEPTDVVRETRALGAPPWETVDPFLFCVHHLDAYPRGDERMGPAASLAGRRLGMDFANVDGWNMYHGRHVPGFPQHPHRGFETVTLARRGFIDHADSLGATARFGRGDVQWMTAGRGISHSEMFPLVDREGPNTAELFQIWLNLPREDKMTEPCFAMLWSHLIPHLAFEDAAGRKTEVTVMAGQLGGSRAPAPPPKSWASRPDTDVGIYLVEMAPHAEWVLPATAATTRRNLYVYRGAGARVGTRDVAVGTRVEVTPDAPTHLANGPEATELLVLQGRPIGEPVAQHGPFVMNTREELQQAVVDYRQGGFGAWPWPSSDPVHPREAGRFARHADGRVEHV